RAESLFDRIPLATISRSGRYRILLRKCDEWAVISKPLIGGVSFKEAGSAVAAANYEPWRYLQCKAESRHELLVVWLVARAVWADDRSCRSPRRNRTRVLHHAAIEQNIGSPVIDLIPRLVELVAYPEVDRKIRQHL